MKFAGFKNRTKFQALGLIAPLLLLPACTTQNAMNNNMGAQPSFAATAPTSLAETSVAEETTANETASAAPQTADGAVAPAYADPQAAKGESAQKLVQVASADPVQANLAATSTEEIGALEVEPAVTGPRRVAAVRASSRDQECLARAMYFESNRSSREGMVAVGSVVMNRLESGKWGNSVCGVVGAHRQFAPGVLSRSMSNGSDLAMASAASVLKGERHPRIYKEVMFFHTAGYRFSYNNMHYVAVAGGNSFYEKRRRMRGQRNTPQHVVMARGSSRVEELAEPVKTALVAPVKAAKSLFTDAPVPTPKTVKRQKPVETEILSAPSAPVVDIPAPAPKPVMANVASAKGGRVKRLPAPQPQQ